MHTPHRRGITLIELMVLVLIVALTLVIIVIPIQSSRENGRRVQCQNNMRNVGLALLNFVSSKNHFPSAGTFEDDPAVHRGDPLKSTIYRAITDPGAQPGDADLWLYSWVIDITPYIDVSGFYNCWNKDLAYLSNPASPPICGIHNKQLSDYSIGIFRCPNDPTFVPDHGNLSYVVNGGFTRWHAAPVGWTGSPMDGQATSGDVLQWTAPGGTWEANQAIGKKLGVMFLGTRTGDQPWDIANTPADIADGAANTLLLGENVLAGYSKGTKYSGGHETNFACPLPNFAMFVASDDVCRTPRSSTDCLGGQLRPGPGGATGKGWRRANQAGTFEALDDGRRLTVEGSFPFVNSGHPGGSNFVFCDGAVRFVSSTIDGAIYATLITPAGTLLPPQLRQSQVNANEIEP